MIELVARASRVSRARARPTAGSSVCPTGEDRTICADGPSAVQVFICVPAATFKTCRAPPGGRFGVPMPTVATEQERSIAGKPALEYRTAEALLAALTTGQLTILGTLVARRVVPLVARRPLWLPATCP